MKLLPRAVAAVAMLGVSAAATLATPIPATAGLGTVDSAATTTRNSVGLPSHPSAGGMTAGGEGAGIDTTVSHPPGVVAQFNALSERADALGFGIGPSVDPTECRHYQGVARSEGQGDPFLFVTHSRNDTPAPFCFEGVYPGELLVVDLASRGDDGERLRSNRLQRDTATIGSPPPASDTTTSVVTFDGADCDPSDGLDSWPGYQHPGAVQLVGDVLAVPLEKPIDPGCPEGLVVFINVSDPNNPVLLSGMDPSNPDPPPDFEPAGVVAVTRQPDDHFLMMVTGGNNDVLRFYRSSGTDLGSRYLAWDHVFDYEEDDIESDIRRDWPGAGSLPAAYQMMNFIRQDDGQLFLFAARNTDGFLHDGADLLDLYRVTEGDSFSFEFVGQRHLLAVPTALAAPFLHGDAIANFAAASGIYVSPSGEILLYATEHDNEGPEVGGIRTVNAGEWRSQTIVRSGSPTLRPTADAGGPYTVGEGASIALSGTAGPPITRAWVELFAAENFGGRSVIIDHPDRDLDDFDNFGDIEGGFDDAASSMRWFAPSGCTFRLNEHADNIPGDLHFTVAGDGALHTAADLALVSSDNNTGDLDDVISSITWFGDCDATYNSPAAPAWDLDGDNTFETTEAAPTFSAHALDGPTTRAVALQATHAASDSPGLASATVRVTNIAPSLSGVGAVDSLGNPLGTATPFVLAGQPVKVIGSFTDPGAADTHVAAVAWGDGVVDQGAATGSFAYTHTYAQPGNYQAVAAVTDDDGGTAAQLIPIVVVDPAAAIEGIADQLDDLLDDGYGAAVNDALSEAIQHLVGGGDGQAASGALDKLQDGDTEAAIVKLIAAVEALQQAVAAEGPTLDAAIDLLGLIGQVLAEKAYADAQTAVAPASPGEQHQLDEIADLIATGISALTSGDHIDALEDFRSAVHKAVGLIG